MPDLLTAAGATLGAAEQVDKALGLLAKLLGKLKAQPSIAAQKLAQTLEEIAKTYQVVDNAISEYLSLGIDQGALQANSKLLLDIEGGALTTEVERGRGHCHVIGNIYFVHLDRWFAEVFSQEDYDSTYQVFQDLGNADDDVFRLFLELVSELEKEAGEVLNMVIANKLDPARERVLQSRIALKPLRLNMSTTMQQLYNLKSEFIQISGVA